MQAYFVWDCNILTGSNATVMFWLITTLKYSTKLFNDFFLSWCRKKKEKTAKVLAACINFLVQYKDIFHSLDCLDVKLGNAQGFRYIFIDLILLLGLWPFKLSLTIAVLQGIKVHTKLNWKNFVWGILLVVNWSAEH